MSRLPKLVNEIIDYYLWRSKVRELNKEYGEKYSEYNRYTMTYDPSPNTITYPCLLYNERHPKIGSLIGWRSLYGGPLRNVYRSICAQPRAIWNFIRGSHTADLPKNYIYSIENFMQWEGHFLLNNI